jgi:hypothetical protein
MIAGMTRESPTATQLWSIIGARGDEQIKWIKCSFSNLFDVLNCSDVGSQLPDAIS